MFAPPLFPSSAVVRDGVSVWWKRGSRGFALILVLAIIALAVILVTSLSLFVRTETAAAGVDQNLQRARQNATVAVKTALGELQTYAGPDQRVSARSDIGEAPDGTSPLENRAWTGIWNADPSVPDYRDLPPAWLVSGNEQFDLASAWKAGNTSPPAGYHAPGDALDPEDSIVLAEGKIRTPAGTEDVDIRVPLVEIEDEDGDQIGAYAYWVGDEGIRANVKLREEAASGAVLNGPALTADVQGINVLDGLADYPRSSAELAKLASLEDVPLVNPDYESAIPELSLDLTTHSRSLLTNLRDGGLKKNLTAALSDPAEFTQLTSFADDQIFGPQWNSSPNDNDPGGPYWSLLRDYYAQARGTGELTIRPQLDTQAGFFPVITYFHMFWHAAYINDKTNAMIRLLFFPAVTLWNPYDRPMPAQTYYLLWNGDRYGGMWPGVLLGKRDPGGDWSGDNDKTQVRGYKNRVNNFPSHFYNQLGAVVFQVQCPAMEPGEAVVFRPSLPADRLLNNLTGVEAGGNVLVPGIPNTVFPHHFYTDVAYSTPLDLTSKLGSDEGRWRFRLTTMTQDGWGKYNASTNGQGLNGELILSESADSAGFLQRPLQALTSLYYFGTGFSNRSQHEADLISYATLLAGGENANGLPLAGIQVWMKFTANQLSLNYAGEDSIEPFRYLANGNPRSAFVGGTQLDEVGFKGIPQYENVASDFPSDFWGFQSDGTSAFVGFEPITTRMILFDSRSADHLASVGDLMHSPLYRSQLPRDVADLEANFSQHNSDPAYGVGNSLVPPWIPAPGDESSLARSFRRDWPSYRAGSSNLHLEKTYYDASYLLNDALWDRYFLTSHDPFDPAASGEIAFPLLNARLAPAADLDDPVTYDDLRDFDLAAEELVLDGGFNVNSTSEAAWETFFASFLGTNVATDAGPDVNTVTSPFLRSMYPFSKKVEIGEDETAESVYTGYRALTIPQIRALARAVVEQVKRRGPFRSVAEFVNRSTEPGSPLELMEKGALQAAIDEASLNAQLADSEIAASEFEKTTVNGSFPYFEHYDLKYLAGQAAAAAPGSITQADILARTGGAIVARSDTFTIIALGETVNPATGETVASAKCEATVQRIVEKVDAAPSELTHTKPTSPFGRRFRIVDFRWLNQN